MMPNAISRAPVIRVLMKRYNDGISARRGLSGSIRVWRANVRQRMTFPFDLHQTSAKAPHRSKARDCPSPVLRLCHPSDQARDDVLALTSTSAFDHHLTFSLLSP